MSRTDAAADRAALVAGARRVVVKVGSSSLTTAAGGIDPARVRQLVEVLAAARGRGAEVVLVSSGAIAAGLAPLGLTRRPRPLAAQQAAASVGQGLLAHRYQEEFARHGLVTGQVLLTAEDVTRRAHYRNAYQTFAKLLELGVLPIVNENDTVATSEIRFGDNDRLAALVAHLVHADLLVLLSDVDGLYDGPPSRPGARLLPDVRSAADLDAVTIGSPGAAGVGTGGMVTKVEAARIATGAGIPVVLDRRRPGVGRAGRRRGGHPVPRHRRPSAHPDALARPRHRRQGLGHPGRRRGACGHRARRLAARRRRRRRRRVRSSPATRSTWWTRRASRSPGGWSTSTPTSSPSCSGRSSRDLKDALGAAYEREVVHRDDLVLL